MNVSVRNSMPCNDYYHYSTIVHIVIERVYHSMASMLSNASPITTLASTLHDLSAVSTIYNSIPADHQN